MITTDPASNVDLRYAKIEGIDLPVSRIAFGCMSTVGSQTYPGLAEQQAIDTIRAAYDHGINFFDTARAYADGESEELLGKAIKDIRDKVVIASKPKPGDNSASEIVEECEHSLRSLGIDCIDLYQIHWPRRQTPMEETAAAMEKLIQQGKVKTIGVCNFGPQDLTEWLGFASCVTDQIAFNMLMRAGEFEVQPLCVEREVGILCYSPLAQGLLAGVYDQADDVPSGKARTRHFRGDRPEARHGEDGCEDLTFEAVYKIKSIAQRIDRPMGEVAISWLLHQPAITSVLVGASRPDQIARNVSAFDLELNDELLSELSAATDPVKQALGASIDMWSSPPRTR
ncbi:MAG: aldo/keto reductase [Planctomycetota bacterium]